MSCKPSSTGAAYELQAQQHTSYLTAAHELLKSCSTAAHELRKSCKPDSTRAT